MNRDLGPDLHLEPTALPAASAFVEPSFQSIFSVDSTIRRWLTFIVGYTPNAAASAGRPRFRLDWDLGTLPDGTLLRPVAEPIFGSTVTQVVSGGQTLGVLSSDKFAWDGGTYDGTVLGAVEQIDEYTLLIPAAAIGTRLSVAEVGDTTNRGTVRIWLSQSLER